MEVTINIQLTINGKFMQRAQMCALDPADM